MSRIIAGINSKMNKLLLRLLWVLTLCIAFPVHGVGQVTICGDRQSYHPVDIKALQVRDSLRQAGIDTIVVYRHWIGTNGFNGYGKVIWLENGRCLQYKYELVRKNGTYGDILVTSSIVRSDSLLRFFFEKHVESVSSNPTKQGFVLDHDSEHYVDVWYQGIRYCYIIKGMLVDENPDDLRASFVNMLRDFNVSSIKASESFIGGFPTPDPDSTTRKQK
ncbi:MAG: hypothetical protein JSS89_01385 [Bacteroidetes bacterium]|nr:hypothetical protein [Bacteroidota bacterium]